MKTAVVYYSASGNTATVAGAIAQALGATGPGVDADTCGAIDVAHRDVASCDVALAPIAEAPPLDGTDLVFVGMPIERFGAPEPAQRFLAEECTGRRVALFVTHAAPDDLPDVKVWLDACRDAAANTDLIGLFHCQGQLAEPVKQAMLESGMQALVGFAEMADCAAGQPDEAALWRAAAFAREAAALVQGTPVDEPVAVVS